jgi:hypothetical protein
MERPRPGCLRILTYAGVATVVTFSAAVPLIEQRHRPFVDCPNPDKHLFPDAIICHTGEGIYTVAKQTDPVPTFLYGQIDKIAHIGSFHIIQTSSADISLLNVFHKGDLLSIGTPFPTLTSVISASDETIRYCLEGKNSYALFDFNPFTHTNSFIKRYTLE